MTLFGAIDLSRFKVPSPELLVEAKFLRNLDEIYSSRLRNWRTVEIIERLNHDWISRLVNAQQKFLFKAQSDGHFVELTFIKTFNENIKTQIKIMSQKNM